jgi:phosphate-selective porin OprO/OprP
MRIPVLLLVAAAGTLAASSTAAQPANTTPGIAAAAEQAAKQAPPPRDNSLRVRLSPRPGLRAGDKFRLDLRGLFQLDARGFDPVPADRKDEWDIPRRRVGIDGEILNLIEFQVEAQLDDSDPWRDVYVNVKPRPWLQFQGGKFKVPYGRERLRGHSGLDFVERSNATNYLTPGRDIGGMVHGRTAGRAFDYAIGFFAKDSASDVNVNTDDPVDEEDDLASPKSSVAGRLVMRPFRFRDRDGFGGLEVGFGMTRTKLPEGLNSLRGRSVFDETFFDRVYVEGHRWRWGVDVYAEGGPATFTAEYLEGADDRLGQGLADDDLPDLVSRGWYVAGTWVLTGQPKSDVDRVKSAFFGGGLGAIEAAVRVDQLRLTSRETLGEPPFRNPRAVNLYPNDDVTWTLGLNWYLNRYLKLQGDAMRERFSDVERTLLPGETVFWSFVARLQFAL